VKSTAASAARIAGLMLLLVPLAGCIDSDAPILTDAKPLFGEKVRFHLYSLDRGRAQDAEIANYRWEGSRYVPVGDAKNGATPFSAHAIGEQLFVVQGFEQAKTSHVDYAVARQLTEGVFLVVAIDAADVDEATRQRLCERRGTYSCAISTPEALLTFARATAAKPRDTGGLAIMLADPR
jgi:hypothetical protein